MSKPTFCRHFKAHSGHTFSDFVTHLRLHATRRELLETERSIIDIALSCGFPTISFFNRTFRRVLGCTPTSYRSRKGNKAKARRK
jgi:AraC-like DNA-binding protein